MSTLQVDLQDIFYEENKAKQIGQFIALCWSLNINPLPGLRKSFNNLEWRLHRINEYDGFTWSDALTNVAPDALIICGIYDLLSNRTSYISAKSKPGREITLKRSYWETLESSNSGWADKDREAALREIGFVERDTFSHPTRTEASITLAL